MSPELSETVRLEWEAELRFLTREKRKIDERIAELEDIIRLFNLKEAA